MKWKMKKNNTFFSDDGWWTEFKDGNSMFWAPFHFFIKAKENALQVHQLFKILFGIHVEQEYSPNDDFDISLFEEQYSFVKMQADGKWLHFMDDWSYRLCYSLKQNEVQDLGLTVYSFWFGEMDESYGFTYYEKGKLLRDFQVIYNFEKLRERRDVGTPLPFEKEPFISEVMSQPPIEYLLYLAKCLGIQPLQYGEEVTVFKSIENRGHSFPHRS